MPARTIVSVVALALLQVPTAPAQSVEAGSLELPELLDREREITLARSAAPAAVSGEATVLVLERGGYVVAVEGTNGVTCHVGRSWPRSLEPHCFDAEGSATILAMHVRRAELRERGWTKAAIDADIAEGLRTGRYRLPSRPAMSYMMSAAQNLYDDEGQHVGAWKPHLMIYYPYLTPESIGWSGPPTLEAAVVVDPGTPDANLMIVVPEAIEPE